jgi:hypothetical protein
MSRMPHTITTTPAESTRKQSDWHRPFWGYPQSRAFAELRIDCEEDRTLRAVLVGMLRESDRSSPG